jgi:hypothetical protein
MSGAGLCTTDIVTCCHICIFLIDFDVRDQKQQIFSFFRADLKPKEKKLGRKKIINLQRQIDYISWNYIAFVLKT